MPLKPKNPKNINPGMRCRFSYYDIFENCTVISINVEKESAIIRLDDKKTRVVSLNRLTPLLPPSLTTQRLEIGNSKQINALKQYQDVLHEQYLEKKREQKKAVHREVEEAQLTLEL